MSIHEEMAQKAEEYRAARAWRYADREEDDSPRCRTCRRRLVEYEAAEWDCLGCQEKDRCKADAEEASTYLGVYVRWTDVRDHGKVRAIQIAKMKALGVDPEAMAYERERLVSGD